MLVCMYVHHHVAVQVGSQHDPKDSPVWPVLRSLGPNPEWVGPVGTAAGVKLALNQLIGSLTVGLFWCACSTNVTHAVPGPVARCVENLMQSAHVEHGRT